jgi:hypothetical protein
MGYTFKSNDPPGQAEHASAPQDGTGKSECFDVELHGNSSVCFSILTERFETGPTPRIGISNAFTYS